MDFGKKYRIGNFEVVKVSRSLTKAEIAEIRKGYPDDVMGVLSRGSMPYIRISDISRSWAVEYSAVHKMFHAFDGIDDGMSDDDKEAIHGIVNMFFADTTIFGDSEYFADKFKALESFLSRNERKDTDESQKEDDEALNDVKRVYDSDNAVDDMLNEIKKIDDEQGN